MTDNQVALLVKLCSGGYRFRNVEETPETLLDLAYLIEIGAVKAKDPEKMARDLRMQACERFLRDARQDTWEEFRHAVLREREEYGWEPKKVTWYRDALGRNYLVPLSIMLAAIVINMIALLL